MSNIQSLSGYTPDQFLAAADAAIANLAGADTTLTVPANYWSWDPFGNLTPSVALTAPPAKFPSPSIPASRSREPTTPTPESSAKWQRYGSNLRLLPQKYRRHPNRPRHQPGLRSSHPGFGNELVPGTGPKKIESYGPWGQGTYDGFTVGFQKSACPITLPCRPTTPTPMPSTT